MVIADLLLIIVALLVMLAAAINDLKTREVPDWISYGLIIAALAIRLMHALLFKSWSYFYYGLSGLFLMYLFGIIMFRTKQWGGGDAKLIMGLGVVFATKPYFLHASTFPFLLILLINILVVGAVYGLVYSIGLAYRHKKAFAKIVKAIARDKKVKRTRLTAVSIAIPLAGMAFFLQNKMMQLSSMMLALLIVIYPYLWVFTKAVEKACLYKRIPASKLTEGDWVEEDIYRNKKLLYKKKTIGIEKKDIARLIKARVKRVLVKDGIPFTPTFFLGAIVSLWYGNIIIIF